MPWSLPIAKRSQATRSGRLSVTEEVVSTSPEEPQKRRTQPVRSPLPPVPKRAQPVGPGSVLSGSPLAPKKRTQPIYTNRKLMREEGEDALLSLNEASYLLWKLARSEELANKP